MELGRYEALFPYHQADGEDAYVCRLSGQADSCGRFCVITVDLSRRLTDILPVVAELKKIHYEDFVEEFYLPSRYCVVFNCEGDTPLWRKEPELDAEDRKIVTRNILETLIYKNTPPALAVGALTTHGVLLGPGHSVGFAYTLPDHPAETGTREAMARLADLLEHILTPGPEGATAQWLAKMKNGEFEHVCEAYARMPEPEDAPSQEDATDTPGIVQKILPAAAALLLLFALLTAAYGIFSHITSPENEEPRERGSIHSLGTIRLD